MLYSHEYLLDLPTYEWLRAQKQPFLQVGIEQLQNHHCERCHLFASTQQLGQMPLAVKMFKQFKLLSVDETNVHRILKSSGTSGSQSSIFLDSETARLQSRVLIKTMQHWLGKQRLPMLILDSREALDLRSGMSARAAGIQGMSLFGRDVHFALDSNMDLDLDAITSFFEKYGTERVFMYGFTFIIWKHIVRALQREKRQFQFKDVFLIHGGGWKKLLSDAVSKLEFKAELNVVFSNVSVHDYYGMVEQTGTIHIECEFGYLHTPIWADITIVDPGNMMALPVGEEGVIQVQSLLPRSYPGHNLLTEDLGILHGEDSCSCGRKGKYFSVVGRVAEAEIRGCSDTFV